MSWVRGFYPGKRLICNISGCNDDIEMNSNFGSLTSWFQTRVIQLVKSTGKTAKIRIRFIVITVAGNNTNKHFSWIKAFHPGLKHLDINVL